MDFSSSRLRGWPYLQVLKVPIVTHLFITFYFGILNMVSLSCAWGFFPPWLVWILWIFVVFKFVFLFCFFFNFNLHPTKFMSLDASSVVSFYFSQTSHCVLLCFHRSEALWFVTFTVVLFLMLKTHLMMDSKEFF